MFTKVRNYTTKLSSSEINQLMNDHKEAFYKFSLGNRYETSANGNEFHVKSMPASRRGIYREKHVGKMTNNHGQTSIELTSKIHKAGPFVVFGLFILFISSVLFIVLSNNGKSANEETNNLVLMVVFMIVMHIVFYLIFIQMFSWMAIKWIEKKLDLEKAQ